MQILQSEVRSLREQLHDSQVKRLNLEETVKETAEQFDKSSRLQEEKHAEIAASRAQALE